MRKQIHEMRAGVIGTGFIGPVHIEALRRLGVAVTALCGSAKAQAVAKQWNIPHVFTGYDFQGLIASPEVDVIHITSPNREHFAQAGAALRAGKHVICEKPLAMTSRETASLVRQAAQQPDLVFAVNYNIRFYPAVLQMRADVAAGRLGEIIHVNGSYFQDWLLKPTDYNWRLLPEEGGELRAVADIGTHWLDTASFILGSKISGLFANLSTFHKTRRRPEGELATFSRAGAQTKWLDYPVATEDFANILLEFQSGTQGQLSVSQVAAGRKNSLRLEIYGTEKSASWDSEQPNTISYGSRDGANEISHRACPGFAADVAGFTDYPPGHAEGFPDTFKMLYRSVYTDIVNGKSATPLYATAADGHEEALLCEAVLKSHKSRRWIKLGKGRGGRA